MTNGMDFAIEEIEGGVSIRVYVTPRASRNKIAGAHNGALKIALAAPPVEGAANKALVEFIAKMLGVPKSAVVLASGETSRNKVIRVEGISIVTAISRLAVIP